MEMKPWIDVAVQGRVRNATKKDILPKFVRMGTPERGTCLRLQGNVYYRDGGDWEVEYRFVNNQLISWCEWKDMPWLNRIPLNEVTFEEWRKDNEPYGDGIEEFENNDQPHNDLPF